MMYLIPYYRPQDSPGASNSADPQGTYAGRRDSQKIYGVAVVPRHEEGGSALCELLQMCHSESKEPETATQTATKTNEALEANRY